MVGVTEEVLMKLMKLLLDRNAEKALLCFNEIYMTGVDTSLFLKLYIEFIQNCIKYLITKEASIVTLSQITINWLDENSQFLEDLKAQLLSTINIKNIYSSEDLKIIIESWIVQECS